MSPLVLALDASTTACKAIVVDPTGHVLAEGRAPYPLLNPCADGWEQDATSWLEAALSAMKTAVGALDQKAKAAIRSIAIAHQRETFVVTNRRGQPIANAIVWMDARSKPEVATASKELDPEEILRVSGKVPCTTPSLYKIRMLVDRLMPELAKRDDIVVLDVHAYLVRALTGELATSTASADPLGLIDMASADWSDSLLELAHVRRQSMPALFEPGKPIAKLSTEIARSLGLSDDVLVIAGAGDGQAAAVGAGVIEQGDGYLNFGTAVVGGTPSRDYRYSRAFRTLFAGSGIGYLVETDLKGGTLTLDWLAERLLSSTNRIASLNDLEAKAERLPPGAEGLMVLPYWAGVMSPYWNDDVGGAIVGFRPDHGPEHIYRSICESLGFEQRLAFEHVELAGLPMKQIVVTGGAAQRPAFLELMATIMGRALSRSRVAETTAFGAAILAQSGIGLGSPIELARQASQRCTPTEPSTSKGVYERLYNDVYRSLFQSLASALKSLSELRS